ncbi:MAG: flagellar basal body P-ring protein FlgI [Planctomyces sp.]|nr:flagellar basal body P-ring protein FlgI [Planctomyces sp.]
MTAPQTLSAILAAALLCSGCQDLMLRIRDPKEYERKVSKANATGALEGRHGHSKLIGDYISVSGFTNVVLEGVGLITNLDGTGEDIPVSPFRTKLMEDMKRRGVKDPNTLLRSKDTALVLVRAMLPPLIKKGEPFDIEVMLPDGTKCTSLSGGWLLECDLKEYANVSGGGVREGKRLAKAAGPILLGIQDEKGSLGSQIRGTVPGGATYVGGDRSLVAMVRQDYRSAKLSHRIAQRIGDRFHDYDRHGLQRAQAEANTDRKITLLVPDRYRDNFPRYMQVVRSIALRESPVERHLRIQALRDRLGSADECESAALQLEAIGHESIPILKEGLKSPILECRFRAAEALAYLGDPAGSTVLKDVAATEAAFRVYALAAMATLDDGNAFNALVELMNSDSVETKYGAFRALSTSNPDDPNIRGEKLPGGFKLHAIASQGTPVVHLTRYQKAEIVLFGQDQKFDTPLMVRAGQRIVVRGDAGSGIVKVARIAAGETPRSLEVSARIADVIRACSDLGASYPDIVQMLVQAQLQHNLPGRIGIDEMPQALRVYQRPLPSGQSTEVQIGDEALVPNLFLGGKAPAGGLSPEETDSLPEPEPESPPTKVLRNVDLDAGSRPPEVTPSP